MTAYEELVRAKNLAAARVVGAARAVAYNGCPADVLCEHLLAYDVAAKAMADFKWDESPAEKTA